MMRRNQRSKDAAHYRRLYKSARWINTRNLKLMVSPLCEWCLAKGRTEVAKIVHHKFPHKGNVELFYKGPFVSLCKGCHDRDAQSFEHKGFAKDVGKDGWPIDKNHPANLREQNV